MCAGWEEEEQQERKALRTATMCDCHPEGTHSLMGTSNGSSVAAHSIFPSRPAANDGIPAHVCLHPANGGEGGSDRECLGEGKWGSSAW